MPDLELPVREVAPAKVSVQVAGMEVPVQAAPCSFEFALPILAEPLVLFLGSSSRGTMAVALAGRGPLVCARVGATRVVQSSLSQRAVGLQAAEKWLDYEETTWETLECWERCLRSLAKGCAAVDDRPFSSVFESFSKQLHIATQTRSKRSSLAWRKALHDTPAGCTTM